MNVYLAAPWTHRTTANIVGDVIEAANHTIAVKWWNHPDNSDPLESRRQAIADLDGIEACEAFVVLGIGPSEGKATEFGYALKAGKPCVVFAPSDGYPNVFRHHPRVYRVVHRIADILTALMDIEHEQEHTDGNSKPISPRIENGVLGQTIAFTPVFHEGAD